MSYAITIENSTQALCIDFVNWYYMRHPQHLGMSMNWNQMFEIPAVISTVVTSLANKKAIRPIQGVVRSCMYTV